MLTAETKTVLDNILLDTNAFKPLIENIDDNCDKTVNRLDLIIADMVGEPTFLASMADLTTGLGSILVATADTAANTLACIGLLGAISNYDQTIATKVTSIDNKLTSTNTVLNDIKTIDTAINTDTTNIKSNTATISTKISATNNTLDIIQTNAILTNNKLDTIIANTTPVDLTTLLTDIKNLLVTSNSHLSTISNNTNTLVSGQTQGNILSADIKIKLDTIHADLTTTNTLIIDDVIPGQSSSNSQLTSVNTKLTNLFNELKSTTSQTSGYNLATLFDVMQSTWFPSPNPHIRVKEVI